MKLKKQENYWIQVGEKIIQWDKKFSKPFLWKTNPEPYYVWISEVMLQQTVVQTVSSYFQRWIQRFPNVEQLAQASIQEVLSYWSGLGYYSRATNILKAAKIIMQEYQGIIPNNKKQLLALPGIGQYTCNAILSIAYQQKEYVVEANVKRVLQRLKAQKWTQKLENEYIDGIQSWDAQKWSQLNQGIMQFGQILCKVKNPQCLLCPLNEQCQAFQTQQVDQIPEKVKKLWKYETHDKLIIVNHKDQIYMFKGQDKLFNNMYQFIPIEEKIIKGFHQHGLKEKQAKKQKIDFALMEHFKKYKHIYTNKQIQLNMYSIRLSEKQMQQEPILSLLKRYSYGDWISLDCIENYPMPSLYQKIIKQWQEKNRDLSN